MLKNKLEVTEKVDTGEGCFEHFWKYEERGEVARLSGYLSMVV